MLSEEDAALVFRKAHINKNNLFAYTRYSIILIAESGFPLVSQYFPQ
jgi:hypothetical protein